LIGPNGSGKSNLIEILGLIRSFAGDLTEPIRESGGIREWLWKGNEASSPAEIESVWISDPDEAPLRHRIAIDADPDSSRIRVRHEIIDQGEPGTKGYQIHYEQSVDDPRKNRPGRFASLAEVKRSRNRWQRPDRSGVAIHRGPERFIGLTELGNRFSDIRLYRDWVFGRMSPVRSPQSLDLPIDYLEPDAKNLVLILKRFRDYPETSDRFLDAVRTVYAGISSVDVREAGEGYAELFVREEDQRLITARRLSDGTLRFLSLLAILCDPDPPPLVCIEEPELGLHPDVTETIAKLLIDAASRTQLIVTTHSSELISALGEVPESVVVCERGMDGTTLRRLERDKMKEWLDKYTLGHLWAMGELGGNRW
jgi:predicted ATPase